MLEQTITQLRQLKLSGMANALARQTEQPSTYEGLAFEQRLLLLADSEYQDRENRKQQRLLKAAKLKLAAHGNAIDYLHPRGLKQSVMASLLQCDWLNKSQNLLITGPCGSGKTYIACAMGHTACLKGYSVKYYPEIRGHNTLIPLNFWIRFFRFQISAYYPIPYYFQ